MDERADIERRLTDLRAQKQELESSIPAHSTKPHHIMHIEDLEEEIGLLEARLRELD